MTSAGRREGGKQTSSHPVGESACDGASGSVTREKRLFTCTSRVRTSVLYGSQETRKLSSRFSCSPGSSREELRLRARPLLSLLSSYVLVRAFGMGVASPAWVLFELTYFSKAFVLVAKTAIASIVMGRKAGKKRGRAVGGP